MNTGTCLCNRPDVHPTAECEASDRALLERLDMQDMADAALARALGNRGPYTPPVRDADPLVAELERHEWWWDVDTGHICNCGWVSTIDEDGDDGRPIFIARHIAEALRAAGLSCS